MINHGNRSYSFTMYISIDNDALYEHPAFEIAHMLQALSAKISLLSDCSRDETIEALKNYQNLIDINGNIVGRYAIKEVLE